MRMIPYVACLLFASAAAADFAAPAALSATPGTPALAPTPPNPAPRVTLVLVERLGADYVAVVTRRAGGRGAVTIAVRRLALRPALLHLAMQLVPTVTKYQNGDDSNTSHAVISRRVRLTAPPSESMPQLEALVEELLKAPVREVPGVGRYPALETSVVP